MIVRTALVCGLAGTAWALYDQLDDHQAYAADRPAAVEQPGGVLDRPGRLPTQASDRARQVVDQVVPHRKPHCDKPADRSHRPAAPPKAEPVRGPKPKPATPPAEEHDQGQPADPIGDVVDEVGDTVGDVEEQLPDPQPTTDPVATLPATDPATLPGAEDILLPLLKPTTAPAAVPPAPATTAAPPVLIGPVPGTAEADLAAEHLPHGVVAELAAALVAGCDDPDPLDLVRPLDRLLGQGHALRTDNRCPTGPHRDITLDGLAAAATGGRTHAAGELVAPPFTALGHPTLLLLRVLWPRSDVPASRTEHPEPGPA